MTTPRISVITPNYNHGHHIERTIRSVAEQTVPVFEHVIVDDGSTDDSIAVVTALAARYPNIKLFSMGQNQGVPAAIARAVQEASGDYIVFLSADDALAPHTVAKFHEVLQRDPGARLICGDVLFTNESGNLQQRRRALNVSEPLHLTPDQMVALQRKMIYVVNGAGALMRRDDILESDVADPGLRWHVDLITLNAIAYRHGVWYIPEILHYFSLGEGNYSIGASIWKRQEPVLARVFALLNSPRYDDIRTLFRDSAMLAVAQWSLRYIIKHAEARPYLSWRLMVNAMVVESYRRLRRLVPQAALNAFVRLRGRVSAS